MTSNRRVNKSWEVSAAFLSSISRSGIFNCLQLITNRSDVECRTTCSCAINVSAVSQAARSVFSTRLQENSLEKFRSAAFSLLFRNVCRSEERKNRRQNYEERNKPSSSRWLWSDIISLNCFSKLSHTKARRDENCRIAIGFNRNSGGGWSFAGSDVLQREWDLRLGFLRGKLEERRKDS